MDCFSGSSSTPSFVAVKNLAYFFDYTTVVNHFNKILDLIFSNVKHSDDILPSEDRYNPALMFDYKLWKPAMCVGNTNSHEWNFWKTNVFDLYDTLRYIK